MTKRSATFDKPFVQKSKKEIVSGVLKATPRGSQESAPFLGGIRIEDTLTIGRPIEEVYTYWRDLSHLPRFCKYLRNVEVLDDLRSRWTVDGPANKSLVWDAVLVKDKPGELISWRSIDGADFENAGSVRFRSAPANRGTEVTLTMSYNPPAGPFGSVLAKLSAKDPAMLIHEQLRRLKQLLETGEISTTDGQAAVLDS